MCDETCINNISYFYSTREHKNTCPIVPKCEVCGKRSDFNDTHDTKCPNYKKY